MMRVRESLDDSLNPCWHTDPGYSDSRESA
jgi:hypothetical protein